MCTTCTKRHFQALERWYCKKALHEDIVNDCIEACSESGSGSKTIILLPEYQCLLTLFMCNIDHKNSYCLGHGETVMCAMHII